MLWSRRPAPGGGGTRGPSAWVLRTAASAVRGAAPSGPGPASPAPRAHTDRRPPAPAARVPVPGPDPDEAREAVQGLVDPSPSVPLAPPEAARTPGPGGGEGASSRQYPGWGLGLTGRGPHGEVRARCQAAVRLGCGGGGLSAGVARPHTPAEATAGRAVPRRVTRPDPAPGSRSPRKAGQGGGRRMGRGGREGVVGEGLWGPQGRVPGLSTLL